MKKLIYVVLILAAVFIGLTFTYLNNRVVELSYLSFKIEVHLAVLLVTTFAIGAVVGYIACFLSSFKVRRALSKAKKELKIFNSVGY